MFVLIIHRKKILFFSALLISNKVYLYVGHFNISCRNTCTVCNIEMACTYMPWQLLFMLQLFQLKNNCPCSVKAYIFYGPAFFNQFIYFMSNNSGNPFFMELLFFAEN